MNETLRRALLQARLTEEDVAVQLQVDPKTVRRWLEGRVPYLRHRWALASLLSLDETHLWPQLPSARTRPDEVRSVYSRQNAVPEAVWLNVFEHAQREIGILTDAVEPVGTNPRMVSLLRRKAAGGVRVRVCLSGPDAVNVGHRDQSRGIDKISDSYVHDLITGFGPLPEMANAEMRIHDVDLYNSIYFGDDEFLVSQHGYGIPVTGRPVLYLRRAENGDLASIYLSTFTRIWDKSQ